MGQLFGLFYKNLKIQSKNKCGVLCQLLTPLVCILIIFGLQNLVDTLNDAFKPHTQDKADIFGENAKEMQISHLLKGYQPDMGKLLVQSINEVMEELNNSKVHVEREREVNIKESELYGLENDQKFRMVESFKKVGDIKVPFNMIVPLNLPLTNKQIHEYVKDQFKIKTCYKILKMGITSPSPESRDQMTEYLVKNLKINANDSDVRRTNCQVEKNHQKMPSIRVPNVELVKELESAQDINDHMVNLELKKLEEVNIFQIDKELQPTDGFMVFKEANEDTVRGLLTANNMQFFSYHHVNYMNMIKTMSDYRIFLNTETYLTMIDILTNSILMSRFNNYSSDLVTKQDGGKLEVLKELTQVFQSKSIKDLLKMHFQYKQDTKNSKKPKVVKTKKKQNILRQVVTLSFSLPDRQYNKLILSSMFQLLNIIFYPFAIGLCLPIILSSLALEKEERVQDLLKINGMSMKKFYFSNLLFWFLFCSIVTLIFFISGNLILDDGFFKNNSGWDFLVFSIGWNLQQIVFAFFLLTMVSTAGAASAVGYILSTLGLLFSVNMTTFIYPFPERLPALWNLLPQSNYVRLMYYFMVKGSSEIAPTEKSEFNLCLFFLYFNVFFYGLLIYLISLKRFWKKVYRKVILRKRENIPNVNLTLNEITSFGSTTTIGSLDTNNGQLDTNMHFSAIKEMRSISKIIASKNLLKYKQKLESLAIICQNLTKKYENGKLALDALHLKINKGEVYGLLGPNGAGKTTLISIITGFLKKTSGCVYVNGLDTDDHKLPKKMALCPQFNIQWPNLTVREHLTIFGFLRNIQYSKIKTLVEDLVAQVDLKEKIDIEASKLSGGMRRRLSIAIALIGDTEIIFLDEPTTGLDPKRRRELWEIIKSIRDNRTFIISTHLMEEAEFLCDRIGVMTHGQLRATGSSNFLKEAFVNYFQVELTLKEEFEKWDEGLKEQVVERLDGKIMYEFGRLVKVRVDNTERQGFSKVLKSVGQCREFVKSWSLKNGSLEDAFAVIQKTFV